jgi:hypothetical protein
VRSILALLVVDPVLHTARSRSPEFAAAPSRAAAWSVVAVAPLPSAPPQLVSPSSALRRGTACARGRAPQLNPVCSAAARRRASSPATAVAMSLPASARMRPAPPDRDPADQIQSRRPAACSRPTPLDSDPTRRIESRHHLNPQATAAIRSRSNGSSQLESARQTPPAPAFL